MHVVLEYIAVTMIILLLVSASTWVTYSVLSGLIHVKEEQLYVVAERVMDKVLLTPGYPPDWGTNFTSTPDGKPEDFGLALYGTRTPYELDPNKVIRLANLSQLPNPLFLTSQEVAAMLGIERDYGFALELKPLIFIESRTLGYYRFTPGRGGESSLPSIIEVELKNYYGLHVPDANTTAIYMLVEILNPGAADEEESYDYEIFVKQNVTWIDGKCTLNFTEELDAYFEGRHGSFNRYLGMILIHTNWQGFVVVGAEAGDYDVATAYVIGNYVIVDKNITLIPRAAIIVKDEIIQAVPEYESLITIASSEIVCFGNESDDYTPACNVINRGEKRYRMYRVGYIEKLSSHVFLVGKYRGEPVVVMAERIPSISIISGSLVEPANAITLVRLAQLFNYPYVVRLTLWRKAE